MRLNSGCLVVFAGDLFNKMDIISLRMHHHLAFQFRVTNGELNEENQKNREESIFQKDSFSGRGGVLKKREKKEVLRLFDR